MRGIRQVDILRKISAFLVGEISDAADGDFGWNMEGDIQPDQADAPGFYKFENLLIQAEVELPVGIPVHLLQKRLTVQQTG